MEKVTPLYTCKGFSTLSWHKKAASRKLVLKQHGRFVKDCMYQAWCEQHRNNEDAWIQAADRLEEAE